MATLTHTFLEVFAVPGQASIIDAIDPTTGRSQICNETLEQVQQRYPEAVRMSWQDWRAVQMAKQQTPITWQPVTQREYMRLLEVLPPIDWTAHGFLVGEPYDHCYATGQARYTACLERSGRYFQSSRPITRAEWRAIG